MTVKPKAAKEEASREAKRMAASLLDVLAGSRTPTQAAETLGVSLPRYYQLESRGLDGLLMACEPRPSDIVASGGRDATSGQRTVASRVVAAAVLGAPDAANAWGRAAGSCKADRQAEGPQADGSRHASRGGIAGRDFNRGGFAGRDPGVMFNLGPEVPPPGTSLRMESIMRGRRPTGPELVGRPPRTTTIDAAEADQLRRRVAELEAELAVATVRADLAAALPRVGRDSGKR